MINKNKIYLIVVFLFLIVAFIYYPKNNPETVDFKIENKTYKVLIADSKDEWSKGLMNIKDLKTEEGFLKKYYKKMPRTMLRYAIEKFPQTKRNFYMVRSRGGGT